MFALYPSNKLEDLSYLLQQLIKVQPLSVLEAETILVESQGMQHWLNLQFAQNQQIAMNIKYPMPSRFIWDTARMLLGDKVPKQSPYRREVLAFRIDEILQSKIWLADERAQPVHQYWRLGNYQESLTRFQLGTALADLYEQYMLYRPDWLQAWQQGELCTEQADEVWQSELWRLLVKARAYHPVALQDEAIAHLREHKDKLPSRLIIFAVNTMPPKTLEFFQVIAEFIDIHMFHLNPCYTFWGDIKTDKTKARELKQQKLAQWVAKDSQPDNPLLANLGSQGKAFFNQLQQIESFEISAFEEAAEPEFVQDEGERSEQKTSLLHSLQTDILRLEDARTKNISAEVNFDESVYVVDAHSALREIQHLHEYLLDRFNQDAGLTPSDVIVMCPAIEDYAPYIDAVFRRPYDDFNPEDPRLPCSVSDRRLADAEPLINSFLELLMLPDSRFELSKILSFLRLPALQQKFALSEVDINKLEWWLTEAHVHWGIDKAHKQQLVGAENEIYTWLWGLKRLLMGSAWGSEPFVGRELAYMPHVEGQDTLLLGRLYQLVEALAGHREALLNKRSMIEWQSFLTQMCETFFAFQADEENAFLLIENAISSLAEEAKEADYNQPIPLEIIRFRLNRSFASVDSKSHFLSGQVTFCSMIPMRSIPFKIIAILGLNDGQFPRIQQQTGFDLMAKTASRSGDRSRRSDDRYLFLEALISARDTLYLSYQGRDVRNNSVREPSLVLKELLNYIDEGYLPEFSKNCIKRLPLQPFAIENYQKFALGYDPNWIKFSQPEAYIAAKAELQSLSDSGQKTGEAGKDNTQQPIKSLDVADLLRFFNDPLVYFYQYSLKLISYEDDLAEQDIEPFALNKLTEYQLKQSLLDSQLANDETAANKAVDYLKYSGCLPDSPIAGEHIEDAQTSVEHLLNILTRYQDGAHKHWQTEIAGITVDVSALTSTVKAPQAECDTETKETPSLPCLLFTRPGEKKAKDTLRLWLYHIAVNHIAPIKYETHGVYLTGKKRVPAEASILTNTHLQVNQTQLNDFIQYYLEGLKKPLLMPFDVVVKYFKQLNKPDEAGIKAPEKAVLWQKLIETHYQDTAIYAHLERDYQLNLEQDRQLAHKLYQTWLETSGDVDKAVKGAKK
ncbi:exodeoxyribonuclease V subunit gamma [Gayadomonas joobiniege]|uniref:exodeoxyribonuclease V subunit gamma n=1 Tax=Gayadomonas joobiniege TaxID=1234606 RepID=UPI0003736FD6|nr:exodeoxyribonuclease V subunit gamma [Gayadomonas joobiniege]